MTGSTLPRTPRASNRRSSMPVNSVVNIPRPRTPAPRTPAPRTPAPIISDLHITSPSSTTGATGTSNQEAFASRNYTPGNLRHTSIFRNSQRHRIFRFPHQEPEDTVANLLNSTLLDSPIRIRPSSTQIRQGTELLTWCDISDNYQTTCPIDLNLFEANDSILRIRQCSHIFREMNLRRHFRGSPACPICRFDIRDYIESPETESIPTLETIE
jgi:hypothetical protein